MTFVKRRLPTLPVLLVAVLALGLLVAAPAANAAPPKRIVALTPFGANTLAGLGVKPVAVGQTLGGRDRNASNLRGLKVLTLTHPNGPNMEELAVLNPQHVLSSTAWAKGAKTMRDLGIKVTNVDPVNIKDAYAKTRLISKLVGKSSSGKLLAARLKRQVNAAARNVRKRPRVLLVLGVGRSSFVMLPNSWGGNLVRKAGGRLITAGATNRSGFARISDETVVKANPDVIIAVPHANSEDIAAVARFLKTNPAWKDSKAVRNNRLFVSTDNSLLQPSTDIALVIKHVRRAYLKN